MEEEVNFTEENVTESILQKKSKKNSGFKTKVCKVISYNKSSKNLDIYFDGYGIRIHNVDNFEGDTIEIKYKGTIGKSNFIYKL